jgi:DNA-binding transcriptional MerR regulator
MRTEGRDAKLEIPAKLYRIGELVRYTPFSRQTIHNYTIMGLISEAEWTEGGHRLYDESVFERLSRIVQLKKTRTLSEIRRILGKEQTRTKRLSGRQATGLGGNRSSCHSHESKAKKETH